MQHKSKLGGCVLIFMFSFYTFDISIIHIFSNPCLKSRCWRKRASLGSLGAYSNQDLNFLLSFSHCLPCLPVVGESFLSLPLLPSLSSRRWFWPGTLYVSHIGPLPLAVAGRRDNVLLYSGKTKLGEA